MLEAQNDQERPCLHCMIVDLIDDFFAEYPAAPGESDKVDTGEADEVIVAVAKTVAELIPILSKADSPGIPKSPAT